ncbi:hypothetical protein HY989_03980 [Candidatus Micrarchaeota archaeon]|nr:hypothetical protein [Candidatus Micrarchaeota archaeon]
MARAVEELKPLIDLHKITSHSKEAGRIRLSSSENSSPEAAKKIRELFWKAGHPVEVGKVGSWQYEVTGGPKDLAKLSGNLKAVLKAKRK